MLFYGILFINDKTIKIFPIGNGAIRGAAENPRKRNNWTEISFLGVEA